MRPVRRIVAKLVIVLFALYLVVLAGLYFAQRQFIYPAPSEQGPLPRGFERVEFPAEDGIPLEAAYRPAEPDNPTIIFFHGNGDNWSGGDSATRRLAEAGYGVMLPEYRGYSGNPGSPSEQALTADGRAAFDWLAERGIAPQRIVLVGNSLGSGVATWLAGEVPAGALVLVSPFASLAQRAGEVLPWVPVGLLIKDPFRSDERIGKLELPVLILHGTADEVIPAHHSTKLFELAENATFKTFEGLGHELAYLPEAQSVELAWLAAVFAQESGD